MFARATVLGKLRTYLHLSLKVRLSENDPRTEWGKRLQVVLNDVARVINKKRRSDHVRVEELLKKARLQAMNVIVCSNSAMLAWRASKPTSPLHDLFLDMVPNGRTRSKAAGKLEVPPTAQHQEPGTLEHGDDLERDPGPQSGQVGRKG